MVENIRRNRENWSKLSDKVHSGRLSGNSDDIYRDGCLTDDELEPEVVAHGAAVNPDPFSSP